MSYLLQQGFQNAHHKIIIDLSANIALAAAMGYDDFYTAAGALTLWERGVLAKEFRCMQNRFQGKLLRDV